jgi:type IV pilus assembly protein PilM
MASFPRRIVLDIGASEIRLGEVIPDRKGTPILGQLSSMELGIDPTKSAEFFPAVLQALEALVRSSGIKPGPASLCLGGPSVFARVIKVPQSDPNQVRQMVGYEAQQAIPAIDEACWDFQLFPSGSGGELEAMILAIKKDSVEEMVVASAKAGLQVECVELAPAATINAFRYNYPEVQSSTLILEVGARSTNIVIVEGEKIFCRIVPLGGASVTQAIATDLQESFAGAETLKKAKGFIHPGGSYEDPADEASSRISKLSRGVVTRLHTEVERSITFYRSQQGGSRPSLVLLAGGGSGLGLMDFFFKEKLKLPVQYFQPFRRLTLEGGSSMQVQKNFPGWTCLAGTALRSLADSPCRLNVMASLKNDSLLQQKNKPAMIAVASALACGLILPGAHGLWQAQKLGNALSPQKAEVEEAESVLVKIQTEQKKAEAQLSQMELALRLQQERNRWPSLLEELRSKIPAGMWINRLGLVSDPPPETSQDGPAKATLVSSGKRVPVLAISGMFEAKSEEADAQVVERFRSDLESGNFLQNVVIVERETPERSIEGKTQQVALKFTMRADWPEAGKSKGQEGGKAK